MFDLFVFLSYAKWLVYGAIFAAIAYKPIYRYFRNKNKEKRRAIAQADMANMAACYQELMINEILKGEN